MQLISSLAEYSSTYLRKSIKERKKCLKSNYYPYAFAIRMLHVKRVFKFQWWIKFQVFKLFEIFVVADTVFRILLHDSKICWIQLFLVETPRSCLLFWKPDFKLYRHASMSKNGVGFHSNNTFPLSHLRNQCYFSSLAMNL